MRLPPVRSLGVDDVAYRYPHTDRAVLDGLTIELPVGTIHAIVGPNGAGKSTLLQVLTGLRAPDRGAVRWNGEPVAAADLGSVRDRVATQFQDFVRFELEARLNIGLGDSERSGDTGAVEEAGRRARIDARLASLPHGYETFLSRAFSGGVDLSAGEWQRVAVARALFRDRQVLLLDEPGTALDPLAEHDLITSLRAWSQDRVVVVVTHRFATAMAADVVHVVEAGRVTESGVPGELAPTAESRFATLFAHEIGTAGSVPG